MKLKPGDLITIKSQTFNARLSCKLGIYIRPSHVQGLYLVAVSDRTCAWLFESEMQKIT